MRVGWHVVVAGCVGAWCCAPEVPAQVESGFSMASHSLAFANFAHGFPQSALDAEAMQRMFGTGVCLPSMVPCKLTPAARSWMDQANGAMTGGRCEGFAVLSSLFSTGTLDPTTFGAANARALELRGNPELQRELAYWFSSQLVPEAVAERTQQLSARDVMPFLAKALAPSAGERYRIGIVKKEGNRVRGGHSVTPIGYYRDPSSNGVYWVRVYDNNTPDAERLLKVDTLANRWEYQASLNPRAKPSVFFGDDTNKNPLYLAPILTRVGTLPCRFCSKRGGVQLLSAGGLSAVARSAGSLVGLRNGEFVKEGTGSVTPSFSNDLDSDATSVFLALPDASEDLTVELSGPAADPLEPATSQSLSAFGPGFVAGLSGLKVGAEVRDTLSIAASGSVLRYENASRTSLALSAQLERARGDTVEVTVDSIASDAISTRIDPMSGDVNVAAVGTTGAPVTVAISRTATDGTTQRAQFTFEGSDAGTLSLSTAPWDSDGGTLAATIDTGSGPTVMTDSCMDGVRSGMESDVDCGAVCSQRCGVGQACRTGQDCGSTFCHATLSTCVSSACADGRVSAGESDVDCGGPCQPCAVGRVCMADQDCAGACRAGTCVQTFVIGVAVTGLPLSNSVELANDGETLLVSGDGSYAFQRSTTGPYAVTIARQPAQAFCTVTNGAGTATANVSNVVVTCQRRYFIGGTVTGLPTGGSVTLENQGTDPLVVSTDGSFTFSTLVAGAFAVTVSSQPMSAVCVVTGGTGTAVADVLNVVVTCAPGFIIGGTVSGLGAGESVALRNAGELLPVLANGSFRFATLVTSAYAVVVDTSPPGKSCVVVGGAGVATADVNSIRILCGSRGSFDLSFNTTGWVSSATGTGPDFFVDGLINPDGSMVLIGKSDNGPGNTDWVVAKLLANGVFDSSFGTNGLTFVSAGTGIEEAYGVFADGTGYLVVGSLFGVNPDAAVVRLTAAGMLDATFATNGIGRFDNGAWEYLGDATRDATGRLVLVGRTSPTGAGPHDLLLVRLNANGSLDTSFGTNGWFVAAAPGDESGTSVAIDPSTQHIVATAATGGTDSLLVRLTGSGAPVAGFGVGGVLSVDLSGANRSQWPYRVLPDGAGVIVVGRANGASATSDLAVVKFTATGALDPTFATGGRLLLDRGRGEVGYSIARSPGGGFYVGGHSDNFMLVTRISNAGAVDPTFGTAGFFENVVSNSALAYHLMVDAEQRVVAVGTIRATGSEDLGVVRLLP
jgi:uncharacterized delta-60 repeat protein